MRRGVVGGRAEGGQRHAVSAAVDGPLAGKNALIVGGGSGIGLGSARLLARDGAAVTIAGRTESKLAAAVAALAGEGHAVRSRRCDAQVASDVRATVDDASRRGELDIAVVVPGATTVTPVLMYDDDAFGAELDANVRPVYLLLKYAGRAMVRAGAGSFVAVSSTAAENSSRYLAAYCAGKAAVDQLVRVAADELGAARVRVNSIRAGFTITPASAGSFRNKPLMQAMLDQQALPRHGEIEDQAHAVRFLAGPESSWVTGQNLGVDGGNTLRAFPDYTRFGSVPDQFAAARDLGPAAGVRGGRSA
jgi:NAD(P)-dependent dehydrogenase (short-subunit alcohol dehydrogenase family)